jgi:very-short-patch-repair endonuclease
LNKTKIPWNKGKRGIMQGVNNPFYNKHHSEESRRKMSERVRLTWNDPEYRRKMSEIRKGRVTWMKGKKHSKEVRRKISERTKLAWNNLEFRRKISEARKNISEETRRKISESCKGRIPWNKGLWGYGKGHSLSEEARRRISEANKGKKHSEESRRKNSEAVKLAWQNPEYRRKISEANKGKKLPEEVRKKISDALKGKSPDLEHRRKLAEATRRVMSSTEFREKISEHIKIALEDPKIREKLVEHRKHQKFPKSDTIPEKMIQEALRSENIEFIKHKPFKVGKSYHQVDIFIKPNLCIEIDGEYWHSLLKAKIRDAEIDNALKLQGFHVLRFIAPENNNEFDVKTNVLRVKETLQNLDKYLPN